MEEWFGDRPSYVNLDMVDLIREDVWNVVREMVSKKVIRPNRVPIEVWKV